MPLTLTGSLHPSNKDAIDWGEHGLMCYACHCVVVIVESVHLRVVQTLEKHRTAVIKVCWSPDNYPHGIKTHLNGHVRLASADLSGQLIVWDVIAGSVHASFSDNNRVATDIRWLPWQDTSKDFLLAMHPPYNVVLWNADTGEKIWKKSYTESLHSMSIDPFNMRKLAFSTQIGNVLLVDDLSVNKCPSKNGQLFRVCNSLSSNDTITGTKSSTNTVFNDVVKRPLLQVLRMTTASSTTIETKPSTDECPIVQMRHHNGVQHMLLIVYSREVLFVDTETLQTVSQITLDQHAFPLVQVHTCFRRDAVFLVQSNGSISLRIPRYTTIEIKLSNNQAASNSYNPSSQLIYDRCCTSESVRVNKSVRISSSIVCPINERTLTIVMSTGRLLFYDLTSSLIENINHSIDDLLTYDNLLCVRPIGELRGMMSGLCQSPTTVRMRPMDALDSTRDALAGKNLAAIGTKDGIVHLVDVYTSTIEKDLQVHSCPIRCLEWGGANLLITSACSQTLSTSAVVRNDVFATDIRTGLTKSIRPETDESPVEMLRVSFYHCYLAIAFRDQPLEIWHLKSFRLLRRMSRTCPIIIDMAWSCKHHAAKALTTTADTDTTSTVYRENLVVLDNDNHLYHVVVKGLHVRDGREVNTQWTNSSQINVMVWKGDYLAFGDKLGRLSIWDLNAKQSKVSNTHRGSVIRLQFSRLAGDHTLAVLHIDGMVVWDAVTFVPLHQLTAAGHMMSSTILDLDLSGSSPILISTDNCFRFCPDSVLFESGPIADAIIGGLFCPCMLEPNACALLNWLLIDNVTDRYSVDTLTALLRSTGADTQLIKNIQRQLESIEPELLDALSQCRTTAERALYVAHLLGETWERQLWTVFNAVIKAGDAVDDVQLAPFHELFWNRKFYKMRQLQRTATFDARRATDEQLEWQVEHLTVLGQLESAIHSLLNVESAQYAVLLKACLLSADHSSTTCQSTVKLVATNLIAAGRISEGIQLLFLIGKGLDACRYLQTYGFWQQSASFAKMSLDSTQCDSVLLKWAEHLCSPQVGHKSMALLLLVSLREWHKMFDLLIAQRQWSTAARLARALDENYQQTGGVDASLMATIASEYARELAALGIVTADADSTNK